MNCQDYTKEFKKVDLFRYDLDCPPKEWDEKFKNYEYDFTNNGLGHKNKAGLFFFADSKELAKNLGKIASNRKNKSEYYLTETFAENLKLIDFSNSFKIYQMLCLLKDIDVDLLISSFSTFNTDKKLTIDDFSQFKFNFDLAEVETDKHRRENLIEKLKLCNAGTDEFNVAIFGQKITDFNNGLLFKHIIKEKYPEIDGYMWKENHSSINSNGITYCLFESVKLGTKETNIVQVNV